MTILTEERRSDPLPIEPDRRRDLPFGAPLVLLALVGGVLPIAFAWHFGALGIPRNDDWAYALAAFHFAGTAKVGGTSWAGMTLVGQLVLSYPVVALVGDRIAALQIEVAALGVVGLLATFDLAKQLLSPRRALFVAVLVAALPMWASLSASYMTDVPGFALAMACLALGARGVAGIRVRAGYFYSSLAIGFLAFTVRDNAIAAPLAVCVVTVWTAARRARVRLSPIIAATAGFVASAALFYAWRRSLPGFINQSLRAPSLASIGRAGGVGGQSAVLVGLLVSPAVVLADPRRLFRIASTRAPRVTRAATAATAGVFGAMALRHWSPAHVLGPGDYVLANGTLGTEMLKGSRPDLVPRPLFTLLAMVGLLALLFVVCGVAATLTRGSERVERRRLDGIESPVLLIVLLAAGAYAVGCALPVALGYPSVFDRYLLPLVPLVAILVLRNGDQPVAVSRRTRIAGCAALAALAAFGVVYGVNSASFDGTKWRVANQAVRLAGDPTRIDGGHIWNDYSARRHVRGRLKGACIVLRAEPRPAPGEAGVVGAGSVWGPAGTQTWVVARQLRPC